MTKGWKSKQPGDLKKVAFALTKPKLNKVIEAHEGRGWIQDSEVKRHGRGYGCLMTMKNKKEGEINHASIS